MSKRSLLIMSFLFVFTFGGAVSDLSTLSANTESKTEQTVKRKKNKKGTKKKKSSKKRSSGKKKTTGKKKSSGKKKTSGKKKSSGKKSKKTSKKKGKRYSKKSKRNSNKRVNSYRSYNSGTYSAPKTYDYNTGSSDNSSREYKRTSEPTESFKKEPKKEGE